MKNIIEVDSLVKQYGDFTAVNNISFSVEEGKFFGFLGPNGAGKTTTMRILATLLKKTSGTCSINGHDIDTDTNGVRHSIGFAMQDISLDNAASGWENLQLLGVLYGLTPKQSKARATELLEVVGLSKVADKWVTSYSGGMRRRLDLAGVLMHHPKVLFLDEPTQGLDPQARRNIWDYLQKINSEGSTIFLTTHYMDEADVLCEDLAFVDKGSIVRRGTPEKLKEEMGGDVINLGFKGEKELIQAEDKVKKVAKKATVKREEDHLIVTTQQGDKLVPSLIASLDEAGLAPTSLSMAKPTLEDVFVKLVGRSIHDEDESSLVKGKDPFIQ